MKETARRVGREAAREAFDSGHRLRGAIAAGKRAAVPLGGLRFRDLRHQAITGMAEAGVSDATLMAVSGHMSRRIYSPFCNGAKLTRYETVKAVRAR